MSRPRAFLPGLVLAVLIGGVVGAGVAALVVLGTGQTLAGAGAGAVVAAAVGFVTAWQWRGRPVAPVAGGMPPVEPAAVPETPTSDLMAEPDLPVSAPAASVRQPVRQVPQGPLTATTVVLAGTATTRAEALDEVGALLVADGAVEVGYVAAMHERERGSSSHMGNSLAVPRGASSLVHRSALALVRYPRPVDWRGNPVRFVVAIAGVDEADQVRLVSRVAEVFLDDAAVSELERTDRVDDVLAAFAAAG